MDYACFVSMNTASRSRGMPFGGRPALLLALMLCAPGAAPAQIAPIASSVAGLHRIPLQTGGGAMIVVRYDFDPADGSAPTLSTVLGEQLPAGAAVKFFDPTNQVYVPIEWNPAAGWTNDYPLPRGRGFWVVTPATGLPGPVAFYLGGRVPTNALADLPTNLPNFNLLGLPYPMARRFGDTALASNTLNNSQWTVWDATAQQYVTYTKAKGSWSTGGARTVAPAEGFFLRSPTNRSWTEPKPYTWP